MLTARKLPPSKRQYLVQPPPLFVDFQHPRLVVEPPIGEPWLHEIKFDGYRLQVRVEHGSVTVWTRNGNDWTDKFPEIVAEAERLPNVILDGELCAIGADGQPDFSRLRASISPGKTADLVFFVFDLLWHKADDLRSFKLIDRKDRLTRLFDESDTARLRLVTPLPAGGRAMLQAACKLGLEGIVSKRRDAPYRSGRNDTWQKAKCRPGQEVVIGGWVQEPARAFKALLVGTYDVRGRLRYAGSVKTGFAGSSDLLKRLTALETQTSPFTDGPARKAENRWVHPELVANVEFAEWTASGKLRQASFKGLRDDKDPKTIRREVPEAQADHPLSTSIFDHHLN